MKNVTDAEKLAWQSGVLHKDVTLTINCKNGSVINLNNSDIVSNSIKLSKILESNKTLSFGDTNAASLEIKCRDIKQDIRGCDITAKIKLRGTEFEQILFCGVIEAQENQTHEDILTRITAFDYIRSIFNLDVTNWWNGLSIANDTVFRTYVKTIIDKLAQLAKCTGMSDADINKFANLNVKVKEKPNLIDKYGTVTGEMLLKWLAQAGNVYITLDCKELKAVKLEPMVEGLHPHVGLYPHKGLYPSGGNYNQKYNRSEYIKLKYEPYKTEKVDQVVITDQEGIGQGQYPTTAGKNILFIDSNPFLWNMPMNQCAENIYGRVKDIYFTPASIECVGMPYIELGDVIKAYTANNSIFSYILKIELKGIQNLRSKFINESEQFLDTHSPSYAEVTNDNGKRILKIQADIVEINELVAKRATIEQLQATNARVGSLEADHVKVSDLKASNARIGSLEADHVSVSSFNAVSGRVGNLEADHVSVSSFNALSATVSTINANYITSAYINAEHITGAISSAAVTVKSFNIASDGFTFSGQGVKWGTINGVNCLVHV